MELLNTAEVARAAGVGRSTVKRWADAGRLASVRTLGGHRRFPRAELETFLRARAPAAPADAERGWIDALLSESSYEIEGRLLEARGRLGAWYRVAGELGGVLAALGDCWRRRELSVLDEHLASERLGRALAHAGERMPASPNAPRCLLACAEGDEHTLGLALAELCLRELGWTPIWGGRSLPTRELVRRIERGDLALVALSASARSRDEGALARIAAAAGRACRGAGARLVLGGSGKWPNRPSSGTRLAGFDDFHALLRERRR